VLYDRLKTPRHCLKNQNDIRNSVHLQTITMCNEYLKPNTEKTALQKIDFLTRKNYKRLTSSASQSLM